MIWKEWPVWLKGGIVGIVLGIILFSAHNMCGFMPSTSTPKNNIICQSVYTISIPNTAVYTKLVLPTIMVSYNAKIQSGAPSEGLIKANDIEKSNLFFGETVLFISYIVLYFLLGSLMGLIISKIKSTKKK